MRKLILTLLLFASGSVFAPSVWALACYSASEGGHFGGSGPGGVTNFYIDPSASVPVDETNGQIVWRGPSQTVTVTCYKDATHYPSFRYEREQVYFWPGKTGDTSVPNIPGIKVGFRYEGTDIYGVKAAVNNFVVPACRSGESYSDCEERTKTSLTITYQPIIVTAPGTFTGYSQAINIFQVDGEHGYNGLYANYRSKIANMDILQPSKCLVELEIQNNDIDYGRISVDEVGQAAQLPLTIIVRNLKYGPDCPSVKLRGYFDNVRDVANKSYIPVFDEDGKKIDSLGIKLYTLGGQEVELNEPVGDGYEVAQVGYDRYIAKLIPRGSSEIKKGKFEGMVVYTVSYL
ncbi:adhesin [Vibrio sp. Of14-4]|uniref:adhesin n=1 Tax=Vibrio sp. Of14-4 TaxID=2724878 RepID=UPI001EF2DDC3|nr:adhesin [Vibrio sp. Of14-4]MCG7489340.1 adhesin [Vibrio sp. Of14-4]